MCTAISFLAGDHYFGRTLDLEFSYQEEVVITPRKYCFKLTNGKPLDHHSALIGMAHVEDAYPLYYEAANEHGLAMAALNFVGYAHYGQVSPDKENLAQFELIPWILGQCKNIAQVRSCLSGINITDTAFSSKLPVSPLHWLIADKNGALVLESTRDGLHIHENSVRVLTNSPSFDWQLANLNQSMHLSPYPPENRFAPELPLVPFSRGMGALGLPGDLSSPSRFVRAAFARANALPGRSEAENTGQVFHILSMVEQVKGCCRLENSEQEYTLYSSCINTDKGIYYYTTYGNHRITALNMHAEPLVSTKLIRYPLMQREDILFQNTDPFIPE